MGWLDRIFRRKEPVRTSSSSLSEKEWIIANVVGTHAAYYPLHNEGREPPAGAERAWIHQLWNSGLDESQLILLVADHESRNTLLGTTWPRR